MENYHKYLHISELERNWGFYVTTVGYCKTSKNARYPDTRQHPTDHGFSWNKGRILDGYYIVFITSGSGVVESAETSAQEVKAGSCFILFPGVWHRYRPNLLVGWEEYWVGFDGSYPQQVMNKFFNPKKPFINTGLNKELLAAFTQLLGTVSQAQIGYPQLIAGITMMILGVLNRTQLTEKTENDPESVWVSQAIFLLQHQLNNSVNIEELAGQFPISYSKFRKAFKRHTGQSPNQYHLGLRLDKAEELLKNTTLSIKEIGYHTGFESPYYFSRLFKKKFGVSPKAFRAK
ncbi:AraC family transcriptional regulator [Chitinophaga sp. 212800010-3]|uniref:helix-turn-helix domain-containing protein n=1 Tax=unclassified Chitinophaga TaxID=2619133 RepID=UPI002DE4DF24|nr:AraC family transcriptional regulator [Chitinophaga sp. 212800010-3]